MQDERKPSMDLKKLLGLIRKPTTPAAELRRELEAMPVAIAEAEKAADALERERRTVLLEGSDDDLAAVEEKIVSANRQTERLCEAERVLKRRLAEAEEREKQDGLTAERDEAEKEAAAIAKQVGAEYPKAAQRMVAMLQRLVDAEDSVERVNAKLAAAGRGDERLEPVEQRVFPKMNSSNPHYRFWHLGAEIRLPFFADEWAPGWGDSSIGFDEMSRQKDAA
jgi:chromosome segregation ATPase